MKDQKLHDSISSPRWLSLLSLSIVSLAVGCAAGFLLGHRQGKTDNTKELSDSKSQNERLLQVKESELNATIGVLAKEKSRLQQDLEEKNKHLATAILTIKSTKDVRLA